MHIRFLLGPAGSGKTHRCLAELRQKLNDSPEGAPLILLAPKQATFQLERQLLAEGALAGYTRLQILSFQRLAEFVFERLGKPAPELLAEEGRVMVLRALLEQKRGELRVFRASARLPGFARQLSQLLRELQQFHLTPPRLEALADGVGQSNRLDARLRDLAVILRAYGDWLQAHQLQDADQMLDLATVELRENAGQFKIENLWLDGFAQMTPQERQLFKAVAGCAEKATIAFCLNHEPDQPPPWHSLWAPVTDTFLRCRDELSALPHVQVSVELLRRDPLRSRFQSQPMLRHLEQHWARPIPFSGPSSEANNGDAAESQPALRLVACANPEAEVEFAAHAIRRFVREGKGRFRDVAVLLRSLTGYHHLIRRTFSRYDIPFFLDRRESVTHHPLAELTRYALRIVAYSWEHEDWFGALKTGLVHGDEASIDRLENEALARGWRGKAFWSEPIPSPGAEIAEHPLERLRQKIVPPFQQLAAALSAKERRPSGQELAAAIRALWTDVKIGQQLERWSSAAQQRDGLPNPALHETVWDQMAEWLKNTELAFGAEALPLKEWLPIVEAGLGSLSVGVIPPALDQVLVGTIDRSRNPDLRSAFVLGVNEGVFPSPPPAPALLNRADRETLAAHNAPLGPDYLQQIGHEHYYGYIACTRSREQTTLTFAHQDSGGRELNPSVFISDLQRLFPSLAVEEFSGHADWKNSEHWSELMVPLLKQNAALPLQWRQIAPPIEDAWAKWEQVKASETAAQLPTELVEKIYGRELKTSVSGLEDFAACPFRFFAARGLRAEERVEFEIDPREKGSFQHELLSEFHLRLKMSGKRWRDLAPREARLVIRAIGQERLPGFRDGLFVANQARRFTGEMLIEGLERLIETLIGWMPQYQFDPSAVEIGFGLKDSALPAWRIDLDGEHALLLRGRIDRVDIHRLKNGEALAVVVDYKSSARKLDETLMHHGLELQLLAYLGALSQFSQFDGEVNISRLIPAGGFYVPLKGSGNSAQTREEELAAREQSRRSDCQHRGRFDGGHLEKFDASGATKGEQFQFWVKKDGEFSKVGNEAFSAEQFGALISQIREFLRRHGRNIYAGQVNIAPFRWRQKTACDFCDYRPVCRFDPWTQLYRVLRPPAKTGSDNQSAGPVLG